jgi:hypothetical protein
MHHALSQDLHVFSALPPEQIVQSKFQTMKNLKYVFALVIILMTMSCTDDSITPQRNEDDPIGVPPPPPPPKP